MENYTNLQNAQIINIIGEVRANISSEPLQAGDSLEPGLTLTLSQGSEVILLLQDGSQQRIYFTDGELVDELLAENIDPINGEENNVQDEIAAIQELITSGDDVELPDTAAGETGNEGTDFITVDRDGNETIAAAGYETDEQANIAATPDGADVVTSSSLVDEDEAVSLDEDTTITGNVLDSAINPQAPATVVTGFEVAGQAFAVGSTATLPEGELTINSDGSYSFAPVENYNGDVPVATYSLENGSGDKDTSTLSIVINPVIDITDEDEVGSIDEDTTISGNVLTNAFSPDEQLVVTGFEVGGETFSIGSTAALTEGELTINEDGSYSFVPSENYNGNVPVATYTVEDGAGDEAVSTLTIVVDPVKDLIDDDEVVSLDEDTSITGNVLTNAFSPDDPIKVTGFEVGGETFAIGTTASTTEGELTINEDGSYSFVPSENYNGEGPVATYTVKDGEDDEDISTLTITVNPVKDLTDDDEVASIDEDTTLTGNVLTNAFSPDDPIIVTGFEIAGQTYAIGATASISEGELTINEDGSYTFLPSENFNGDVPVATYIVEDEAGDEDTSTLTISVNPVKDLTDDNEVVRTDEDITLTGNVLENASSPDEPLSITDFTVGGVSLSAGSTAFLPQGNLTISSNGSYTFVPTPDYNGSVPVATYTVEDGAGDTDTSTLTITVDPVADSFLSDGNENVSTNENTNVSGSLLSNTSSSDNQVTVTSFSVGGVGYAVDAPVALAEGILTINANGSYLFEPKDGFSGSVPVVNYSVQNGAGNINTSTLTINVLEGQENSPPVAADDSFSVNEGSSVSGNVITHNDGDGVVDHDGGDGATLSITHVNGNPLSFDASTGNATVTLANGTLVINALGVFTYTDTSAGTNNGSFNYTLSDGTDSDNANVTIGVVPVDNVPPVAADDSFSVDEGASVSGNVITHNDGDGVVDHDGGDGASLSITHVNGNPLSFDALTGNATVTLTNGTLVINALGVFTYTDTSGDASNGSFNYTLSDGTDSDNANVTIGVVPAENVPPVAADDSFSVDEGASVSGNVITHNDGDGVVDHDGGDGASLSITHVNGNPLSFDALTGNATVTLTNGTLVINALGVFTYTDTSGDASNGSFNYTLSDGTDSDNANVTIGVVPAENVPPVAADDSFSVDEGASVSGNVITHNDGDGVVDHDGGDGASLSITHVNGNPLNFDAITGNATVTLTNGTLVINALGVFTYTDTSGDASNGSFNYTLSDGTDTDNANVTIGVVPAENVPPVAADDSFSVDEGASVSGNVITHNDGDGVVDHDGGDGASLSITHVNGNLLSFNASDSDYATVVVEGGTLRINAQGDFTYLNSDGFDLYPNNDGVPNTDYPNFEYTLYDGTDSDTANVTIAVNDTGPLAVDDNNYVNYESESGLSKSSLVRGIILKGFGDGGSSGDRADSSPDGTVILTQVEYGGNSYVFDAANTSFNISTGIGTLIIDNQGKYFFILNAGVDVTTIPSSLQFEYTIKDGDIINPETDDATLTINLNPLVSGGRAAAPSDEDDLIDLSLTDQLTDSTVNAANISPATSLDLSDVLSTENGESLDSYLAFNDSTDSEELTAPNDELVLENIEAIDAQTGDDAIVTNGFLKEGATIHSDSSADSMPKQPELDSNDYL